MNYPLDIVQWSSSVGRHAGIVKETLGGVIHRVYAEDGRVHWVPVSTVLPAYPDPDCIVHSPNSWTRLGRVQGVDGALMRTGLTRVRMGAHIYHVPSKWVQKL